MILRRLHLAIGLGLVFTFGALLFARRVADAQRRRPGAVPLVASAHDRGSRDHAAGSGIAGSHGRVAAIDGAIDGFDPTRMQRDHAHYVVDLADHRRAVLTVEPTWQRSVQSLVDSYQIPRASVVVLDTETGRVRVYVNRAEPGAGDLARDATAPAASVFKIVTASALVTRGVNENAVTCFSGGFHAIGARDLVANPRRDRDCISLAEAFGRSANTVFARRAVERLTPPDLLAQARAWGFGESVPFDALVEPGLIDVPESALDFARAAAGFWHSHLSAVHGAVIAQAIARGGEMQRPFIVDSLLDAEGNLVASGAPHVWRRAVSTDVAAALSRMMTHSVSEGTAFHAFHDPAGRTFLPGVDVGGKTGTLTGTQPFRAYTWFVGNASNGNQRVSFAVMVANGPVWRVRASTLARQVLQIVFHGRATD
jgi:cell division protein FtsI/penicillin-binding protein 2